jgi:hypothetical protein
MFAFLASIFSALLIFTALPSATEGGMKHQLVNSVCAVTEEDFLNSAINNSNAKVFVASKKAMDIIIGDINNARVQAKLWAFEADKLRIGLIKHNGQILIGVAMFKDRCVVPGSVKVFPAAVFVTYITNLGLSMDEFKPEQRV